MCLIKVYLTNTKQCRWHLGMFKEHHDWLRHIAAWRRNILQPECFANLKQNAVANAMWRVPRSAPNVVSAGYRRKDVCRPYCGGGSRRGDHLLSTAAATFSYSTHLHLACTLDLGPWSLQRKGDHSLSTAATFSFSYSTHLHLAYTPQSFHFDAPSSALLHHSAALSNSSSTGASQRQVQGSYSTPNPVRHVCLYRHTHIGIPI